MIIDQFGRPFNLKPKKADYKALPVAPIHDAYREYVAAGLTPERLATIFREADMGDMSRQAELFEQIEERDGHLIGETGKRKNVILDAPFKLLPASEDKRDVQIQEDVQENLIDRVVDEDTLIAMQDAVGKGYSAHEIKWDISEGQVAVLDLKFIEQKRFIFQDNQGLLSRTPKLITDDDMLGIDIPAWKVLFHGYGGKSGHPTRSAIFRVCAWWYLFKNFAVKDWLIFCDIYGVPLRLGRYEPGADKEDVQALFSAVRQIGVDAAGVISKATEIEILETAKGSGTSDLYKTLASFANAEQSKAILGQTLSAEVGDKGSYAAAKSHEGVRYDLYKADARADASTITKQLIRPYVGYNYGWDAAIPHYKAIFEKEEDLKAKAETLDIITSRIGVQVPVTYFYKEFKIPEPKKGEAVVGGAKSQDTTPSIQAKQIIAKQNKNPDQDITDIYEQKIEEQSPLDSLVDPIKSMVLQAKSLEELRDNILDIYDDMDAQKLGELMQQALTAAELAGMREVQLENATNS